MFHQTQKNSQICQKARCFNHKRPKEISGDSSPEVLAWRHAIMYLKKKGPKIDIFLSLPPTAPLRKIEDVERVLRSIKEKKLIVVTAKSHNSPWFNMIIKNKRIL